MRRDESDGGDDPALDEGPRLKMVAVQVLDTGGDVILSRGCTEFKVSGERASEAVRVLLGATAEDGSTRAELLGLFALPDRPEVNRLIQALIDRDIVYAGDPPPPPASEEEAELEVFYWHFRTTAAAALAGLNRRAIAIVGVNHISRRLVAALRDSGTRNVEVVDFTVLRNRRFYDDEGRLRDREWPDPLPSPRSYEAWGEGLEADRLGCLVATSDFGGQPTMRQFNAYCVANGVPFLPILLDRLIGFVGPLVVPGETACYECLRAREASHLEEPEFARATESPAAAWQRQFLSAFHPSAASILADVAVMELTKFLCDALPSRVGRLIEVAPLKPDLRSRKVLRVPRCEVCGALNRHPSVLPDKFGFAPVALSGRPGAL